MWISPSDKITSGFFRNHLYVTLGLCVLATVVGFTNPEVGNYRLPLVASVLSYVGAVAWLYEKRRVGSVALGLVAFGIVCSAIEPIQNVALKDVASNSAAILWLLAPVFGGLVLGATIAAMLLGHWYLNTPTMQLAPLKRLTLLMTIAVILRAAHSGTGLVLISLQSPEQLQIPFLVLRWLCGIAAPLVLTWMTWKTLAIPNTQSATGILYVAVITTFTGELTAQLLSAGSMYPL